MLNLIDPYPWCCLLKLCWLAKWVWYKCDCSIIVRPTISALFCVFFKPQRNCSSHAEEKSTAVVRATSLVLNHGKMTEGYNEVLSRCVWQGVLYFNLKIFHPLWLHLCNTLPSFLCNWQMESCMQVSTLISWEQTPLSSVPWGNRQPWGRISTTPDG